MKGLRKRIANPKQSRVLHAWKGINICDLAVQPRVFQGHSSFHVSAFKTAGLTCLGGRAAVHCQCQASLLPCACSSPAVSFLISPDILQIQGIQPNLNMQSCGIISSGLLSGVPSDCSSTPCNSFPKCL